MNVFGIFNSREKSASKAKERLTLVLAHERTANIPYLEEMQREILQVVQKYAHSSHIHFTTHTNQNINTLEVEITLGNM